MADYLEIIEIRDRVNAKQGITKPFKCVASDKFEYFVKGRYVGTYGCIKEWLGAHLARSFGLPIPPFFIVTTPIELLEAYDGGLQDLGESPAFASRKVPFSTELKSHIIQQVDVNLQRDIVVFDAWLSHDDRNLTERGGNPNLLWAAGSVHVIDQNNILDSTFDQESFRQYHVFCNSIRGIMCDLVTRQHYERKMQSALEACWDHAWDTMPDEWKEQNNEEQWINPSETFSRLLREAKGKLWERL